MSSSQMLKGILEGCLLAVINKGETYGYEMIEKLEQYGFYMISEGSIYPVLLRMQKDKLVTTTLKESPSGPKRKYYSLTVKGIEELEEFKKRWLELSGSVSRLLQEDRNERGKKLRNCLKKVQTLLIICACI
ncbi:PadR family transcriptional regulator [Bacillus sp. T33-2]|uniref:PadR family transcriptional regulator n=1 Tax=Bacillus sp. T33-2 TaxID=2054168 RepID=UPI000C77B1E0|nr:PadR family transcriptional regulator [Bacillus sp. T33-2]PLR94151.1 PadR family transcriptional regulator [Bacillus sp. T33-2]